MYREDFISRQQMLQNFFEFHHFFDSGDISVAPHEHEFFEFYYFLAGDVSYNIEGKEYKMRSGDILLTGNQDIHYPIIHPGPPYDRIVIWIDMDFGERLSGYGINLTAWFQDVKNSDYRLIRPDEFTQTKLRLLCEEIAALNHSKESDANALICARLIEFLVYLRRAYYNTKVAAVTRDITENTRINQIITYINDHLSEELSVSQLSQLFYISEPYLCKTFKRYTGLTVYQYIIKKRLIVSRNMLRDGASVMSACYDCGFKDYSNYLKAFKREFGATPRTLAKIIK